MKNEIALSIAHHVDAQGASYGSITEFGLSTAWVLEIAKHSERIWVPSTGSLPYKVKQINDRGVVAAFELHFNACGGCGAKGCETLYYPGSVKGKQLASAVQIGLTEFLGTKDRGVKEGWYKMDRPGVVDWYGDKDGDEMPDYFLRKTKMPSAILEPLFLEEAVDSSYRFEEIAEQFARVLETAAGIL